MCARAETSWIQETPRGDEQESTNDECNFKTTLDRRAIWRALFDGRSAHANKGRAYQARPSTLKGLSTIMTKPLSEVINREREHEWCAANSRTCLALYAEGALEVRAPLGYLPWTMVRRFEMAEVCLVSELGAM